MSDVPQSAILLSSGSFATLAAFHRAHQAAFNWGSKESE
jgi:hypothetical protein